MLWLVAYDIPVTKRRNKIAKLLLGYGKRVQYSVFECDLDDEKFQQLKSRLVKLLQLPEDSLRCYPLIENSRPKIVVYGGDEPYKAPDYIVV
ncbi:CRISPR-associated endonuclease Cas2 [Gloeobacter morelensis]|uniref:CRISPR-associated endoribonuclease Cas2 n=1 Tax=Gloeobacter morelensis MG652769 TaxID=2781736 RepID=A0ABY3PJ18_9CYAN|nr:CRISPR-associated endonuclease Cas2 [Gloeobacter morelensis]UFP93594.1 CRISPR-associated endonuclease Cas2 [Gloeobacter morelensis MG652769]